MIATHIPRRRTVRRPRPSAGVKIRGPGAICNRPRIFPLLASASGARMLAVSPRGAARRRGRPSARSSPGRPAGPEDRKNGRRIRHADSGESRAGREDSQRIRLRLLDHLRPGIVGPARSHARLPLRIGHDVALRVHHHPLGGQPGHRRPDGPPERRGPGCLPAGAGVRPGNQAASPGDPEGDGSAPDRPQLLERQRDLRRTDARDVPHPARLPLGDSASRTGSSPPRRSARASGQERPPRRSPGSGRPSATRWRSSTRSRPSSRPEGPRRKSPIS